MDPLRRHARHMSDGSNSTGSSSPSMSPAHRRLSAGGVSTIRRTQNEAARAANARLAKVMTQAVSDDDDDELDDLRDPGAGIRLRPGMRRPVPAANGRVGAGGVKRYESPKSGRNPTEDSTNARHTPTYSLPSFTVRPAHHTPTESLPSFSARPAPLEPPRKLNVKPSPPAPISHPSFNRQPEKRLPTGIGYGKPKDAINQREASALQDELEILQEENENILDKLRLAEERFEKTEARARQLEKQVATLGEGVSLEAKLLSRKEAAIRQREEALARQLDAQTRNDRDEEIGSLQQEVELARDQATTAIEQLREAESEVKALTSVTQRMILTQEEMEEVVLKRCWLARYWGLALQLGVYPDIAVSKHEHWSSLAPLPYEVVIAAGQKAKEGSHYGGPDHHDRSKHVGDLTDVTGEGNIESMLSVEQGLRELASLKVEDAVVLVMAHQSCQDFVQQFASDVKAPCDLKSSEAFELSQEESEEVFFKQAWLIYFWSRAKAHGVEEDIADERLQFWISRSGQAPTSHDAVDVDRGIVELRKLGIEQQLWEASRREMDQSSSERNQKLPVGIESPSR